MIGNKYTCDGQMSIFDFFKTEQKLDAPIVLFPNQTVYRVIRGDVIKYIVLPETWTYDGGRGYRLQGNSGTYWTAHNSELGKSIFTVKRQAEYTAEKYIREHDVIHAENMRAIETVAYSYIRKGDGRQMIAFYSVLDNGYVYMKEFMTYAHLVRGNKALKKFMEQSEIAISERIDYMPVFKNMYKCKGDNDWIYADAEYGGCE